MQIVSDQCSHISVLTKADIFKVFSCHNLASFYDPSIWSDNTVREQTLQCEYKVCA